MKRLLLLGVMMLVASLAFALPKPKDTKVGIDAYSDTTATGFFLYWQDGASCNPGGWTDSQKFDVGMPTRSTDGLRDEWLISDSWGLKGTDCIQVTAYDAEGNESEFSSVENPGDNIGWMGIGRPEKVKTRN